MNTIEKINITVHQTLYGYKITSIAVFEHEQCSILSDIFLLKPGRVSFIFESEFVRNHVLGQYTEQQVPIELFLPDPLRKKVEFVKNIQNIFHTHKVFVYKEYECIYDDLVTDIADYLLLPPTETGSD
jgi:hypothetical protein